MGNPSLGLNKDKLPELLDADQQNVLLKRYYETTKASLRNCYKNVAVIIFNFLSKFACTHVIFLTLI